MSATSRGALAFAAVAMTAAAVSVAPSVRLPGDTAAPGAGAREDDRAIALGYLIDAPRPEAVVEEALSIADRLRARYGIDTGDRWADRAEAARRAQTDLLDGRAFQPAALERMARELGYSLDPAVCADACDNVRRLAVIELQKQVLKAFVEGG